MSQDDQAVRRAAGVIMWHLERRHPYAAAVAAAQAAEPALKDSEIGFAGQWAQSAILFADLVKNGRDGDDVCQLAYISGLPVFAE